MSLVTLQKCLNQIVRTFCEETRHQSPTRSVSCFRRQKTDNDNSKTNPWPGFKFSGSLRPVYPLSAKREVPEHIARPDYADHHSGVSYSELAVARNDPIKVLNKDEIDGMRVVCALARECLDKAISTVQPGITTDFIDKVLHQAALERNCYPSPLNYNGFPKSCCTSVNEVICHGIPDIRKLQTGDIINIDVSVYHNGFHGDLSETVFVGEMNNDSKLLLETTHDCLMLAISEVKPGLHYSELGKFIEKKATLHGFSVNKSYCGHGINQLFHTNPNIPHHAKNNAKGVMKPGHVFTIEPMINQGTNGDEIWPDGWTVVTGDGKRSAQFEHTVLVTKTGVDVLTGRLNGSKQPYFMD